MNGERGAAWRRRQRRLRSWWRHEQQTVAAVLAAVTHHSHSKVGTAYDAPRGHKKVTSTVVGPAEYYELSSDDGRPTEGERPEALLEPWPQGKLLRHDGIAYELVQALDTPVLQTVEQLPNVVQFFATQLPVVAEPVIEVPKILPHDVPPRRLCRDTQLAEQLVEVPTILYFLKQRIPEQIDDNPVPHGGRGASGGLQGFLPGHSSLKRTANKIADLPAPRSGVRRLQGFLPEQSSTATSSSSLERISERIVEQIAVCRVGEGLQDFLPGQSSSSSSHDPARGFETLDEPGHGFFALFPNFKKVRHNPRTRGQNCLRTRAHGRRLLMTRPWCLRRRRRRKMRSPRTSLSSLLSTCSTMCIGGVASGTQLISSAGHTIWRPLWLIGSGPW